MSVAINIDDNTEEFGTKPQQAAATSTSVLDQLADQPTRVEGHLDDVGSDKKFGTADMHSLLESWLDELQPAVDTDAAETVQQAVDVAATQAHATAADNHQAPRR